MTDESSVIRGVRGEGAAVVLELGGEIDMKNFVQVRDKFKELYRKSPRVLVVNLSAVEFMDSSGLATLVGALKWCRQNGCELKLVGLAKRVRSVFEICRLESIFEIYDSESEALSE